MNKLELLLDGTTIINFPFYVRLFKRYMKSSILLMALIFSACVAFYIKQEDFYWTSISFSDATADTGEGSPRNLTALMGERRGPRSTDILNLRSSIDFNRRVAQGLIENEFFKQLRFDLGVIGKKNGMATEIEKSCVSDRQCMIASLAKRLPAFYQISDKDRSGVNFTIEVKSLSALTSSVLLKTLENAVIEARKEVVKRSLQDQEKNSTNILIEKKKEVDVAAYYEMQEERDRLDNELKEVQFQLDRQVNIITTLQDSMVSAEASFERSKKISKRKVDYDEVDTENRKKELRERIEKLNSDLAALEDVSLQHSEQDKAIIAQIKQEIADAKVKFSKFKKTAPQSNLNQFIKENDEKLHSKEMEFKIASDQLNHAKEAYEELNLKRKDILGRKIKAAQNIEIIKPSIEFIKELEQKIEQLKLMGTTVGADVRFDNYSSTPEPVKKIGIILIIGYLVILEVLLLVFYLTVRFFFDNYIYDEDDMKSIDPYLKVIGNGPEYE